MPGRQKILLDLVDVADGLLATNLISFECMRVSSHRRRLLVLVFVRFAAMPIFSEFLKSVFNPDSKTQVCHGGYDLTVFLNNYRAMLICYDKDVDAAPKW